ncbi:B-lymphocyte antigen CD20-like isoform X2 [Ahaetulla prasina]|uniref:B-lymphocyte antigen CD20-like isoform X2 n=1 Tax=Ahaetulla prasina TaxID=499056 RepID=UPI002648A5E8|nr:B-lymphocyte antigen CD20-like isoform X2 [Ahaetulla prasina]
MDSPLNLDPGSPSSTTQADLPVPLKKFFQGKPLALGITQIFIGIIGIIFGIILDVADVYLMEYFIIKMPYWSGILYIISGSLAVAAARNPKIPLVSADWSREQTESVSKEPNRDLSESGEVQRHPPVPLEDSRSEPANNPGPDGREEELRGTKSPSGKPDSTPESDLRRSGRVRRRPTYLQDYVEK